MCASILIITFINSLPKINLSLNRHLLVVIGSVSIAVVSMGVYSMKAPGYVVDNGPVTSASEKHNSIAAFGMASRSLDVVMEAKVGSMDNKLVAERSQFGRENYQKRCVFCHGNNLEGVTNLGVGLMNSDFVTTTSLKELIEMLKVGRMPNSDSSITGGVMPGFSWLSESELNAIASYIKSTDLVNEDK